MASSFSPSTITSGHRDSPPTTAHCKGVSIAVLNTADKGGKTITLTIRKAQIIQAVFSFPFPNSPSSSTEPWERILKLCTSWDRLNTAKAMVRPIMGSMGSMSNQARPAL